MNHPKRILVIKFRHIGDVLLTGPLISTLKFGILGSHVSAAVKPGTEAMLSGHPDLDQLYVLPERREGEFGLVFFLRTLKFLRDLRRQRFDLAINTTEGDRGILLSWLIAARERWGIVREGRESKWQAKLLTRRFLPLGGYSHTVIRNLSFAIPLSVKECREVKLFVSEKDETCVRQLLEDKGYFQSQPSNLVHCHPTSRWMFKCWPANKVAETIDWLHEQGCQVVLTCAPDAVERTFLDSIVSECKVAPIDLGGLLTLKQVGALSRMSKLFWGVDSAPMHMAAALDTPTLGIFGPSGTFDWGPWPNGWKGQGTPYPQRNGVQHSGKHVVVQDRRACVPCGKAGCENERRSACLEGLSASVVMTELAWMLDLPASTGMSPQPHRPEYL